MNAVGAVSDGTAVITTTAGDAHHFKVTAASSTPKAGANDEITVTAYDEAENRATGYAGAKTLVFSGLADAATGEKATVEAVPLGSDTTVNFTGGVSNSGAATLIAYKAETASLDAAEKGSTINSGSYGAVLTVAPGNPYTLTIIQQQPANTDGTVDNPLQQQPIINAKDQYGNNCADGVNITATLDTGTGTLLGGTTAAIAEGSGDATFTTLGYNKSGEIFKIKFTAEGGDTSATVVSDSIAALKAGNPSRLDIKAKPTIAYTYVNLNPQPVVHIVDQYGNTVTDNGSAISIEAYTADNFNGTKSEFNGTSTVYATHNGLSISDPENPGTPTGVANFAGIKYNTINTTGIYLCA